MLRGMAGIGAGEGGGAMAEVAMTVRVTGHVQGVAYRAWARAQAGMLGLRGWVRNRGDGSVLALIAGPEDRVEEMIAAMREGPGAARVTDVWTEPADPAVVPAGFSITG
jgi:acylphosphatase